MIDKGTTTFEVAGSPKNESVEITASLAAGTSTTLKTTGGLLANTCTASHAEGSTTSPYSGATTVGGPLSSLSFSSCTEEKVVVDEAGSLTVEWTSGTNGTVRSAGAEVKVPSPFGKLTCKTGTGTGTDIGTLTGVKSGNATMDINGVLNCGIIPSAVWEGSYTVTSPSGLGVSS
ncbi:MAG TPA: hypothetical protein VNS60_13360 [Solirubrobacterales bacterium]|nr:hypothetical protein [Solirubrobacterales bacterium]